MSKSRTGLVAALGLLALAGLGTPAHALKIELKDIAADRVERQRLASLGALPLPGTPDLASLQQRLDDKGVKAGQQIFIRVFKSESELEVWMRRGDEFVLFATYPICHWSGTLGPKLREGDKQNPEGFYTVGWRQLHRVGRWPRSLNLGFPNVLDRTNGRTGSYILIHGGCSSVGCFAMTNAVMEEIYDLSERALRQGQGAIHVHVFPFRMTEENLAAQSDSEWIGFWRNLKNGYDAFEATRRPPRISVCESKYVIQETGPAEVGDHLPLALCGETFAATLEREMATSPAPHREFVARPPLPALQAAFATRAETTTRTRPSGRRVAGASPAIRCNLSRPSCRRWVALRSTVASKASRTAARSTGNRTR